MFNNPKGSIDDYLYVFFGRNGVNGIWQLRKEMFNKFLQYNPNVNIPEITLIPCLIDKNSEDYFSNYEGNREADAAFILEKILFQMEHKRRYINKWFC